VIHIKRHYFEHSGEFFGWLIFWANYRYRTVIYAEHGWKGQWPKDLPRLLRQNWRPYPGEEAGWKPSPWWHGGSLMLIDRRIIWRTQLWITGPESYTVTQEEIADNLYETKK
jgi:hypothetical protein